jgi:hypothetical protein
VQIYKKFGAREEFVSRVQTWLITQFHTSSCYL